jgi:HEAT repeat protein
LVEKLIPKAEGPTAFAVAKLAHAHFDGNVRQIMLKWLGQMDPKVQEYAIPELAVALSNADPKVQLGAMELLSKLGEKSAWALPELATAAADSPNDQVRLMAIHLIGEFGAKSVSVVPGLARRVTLEPIAGVRGEVVKTLGLIGPGAAPALADLKTATQDTDAEVQKLAREAIKLIEAK